MRISKLNELRIWGRENSINVQKVLWLCEDLNIPYERIDAGMEHGVNKTPEYLKINPNGLVPTISDNGFILWESHAVMRYLIRRNDNKSGSGSADNSIYPRDSKGSSLVDQWLAWISTICLLRSMTSAAAFRKSCSSCRMRGLVPRSRSRFSKPSIISAPYV